MAKSHVYSRLATDAGSLDAQDDPDAPETVEFNKKRDLCLGFLILAAIVYVLQCKGCILGGVRRRHCFVGDLDLMVGLYAF